MRGVTVLPGMPPPPNPDAMPGCEHSCISAVVELADGTCHPCPTHAPKAFESWTKGAYKFRATDSEPRKLAR